MEVFICTYLMLVLLMKKLLLNISDSDSEIIIRDFKFSEVILVHEFCTLNTYDYDHFCYFCMFA